MRRGGGHGGHLAGATPTSTRRDGVFAGVLELAPGGVAGPAAFAVAEQPPIGGQQSRGFDLAADVAMTMHHLAGCKAQVLPFLDDIAAAEGGIASRIAQAGSASTEDIIALDQLMALSAAGGQARRSPELTRTAEMLLKGLDDNARDYGPWLLQAVTSEINKE